MEIKVRQSNYELMRIVSMLLIIFGHVMLYGGVLGHATGMIGVLVNLLEAILIIHVDSFILVTGYYQCKTSFKFKRLVSLNNAAWFYRVVIMLVLIFLNVINVDQLGIIRNVFPIDLGFYWFIDTYLLLYCLTPFLNLLISKMDKHMFNRLLIVLFSIISILPTITRQQAFPNGNGYSLTNFVLLYFVGAYLRINPFSIWDYLKITSLKMKQLIYFILFFAFCFINFAISSIGVTLLNFGDIAHEIGSTIVNATYAYDNPLVIGGAVMYFLWFGCLRVQSKVINRIGSLVFGIYLVHENFFVRPLIYKYLGFSNHVSIDTYSIFPKIFATTLAIFIICMFIELVRQLIFKLISKLWLSRKIKQKWYNYIEELRGA